MIEGGRGGDVVVIDGGIGALPDSAAVNISDDGGKRRRETWVRTTGSVWFLWWIRLLVTENLELSGPVRDSS